MPVPLPAFQGRLADADLGGDVALEQTKVQTALSDVVAQRLQAAVTCSLESQLANHEESA